MLPAFATKEPKIIKHRAMLFQEHMQMLCVVFTRQPHASEKG